MTEDIDLGDLSEEEMDLLKAYIGRTEFIPGETVASVLTQDLENQQTGGGYIEDIIPLISDSVDPIDVQMFLLLRRKRDIEDHHEQFSLPKEAIDQDAKVTPDKLNRMWMNTEITAFFNLAGILLETLTTELVMKEFVADDRTSETVRDTIENKPQAEKEWLLDVTGILDNGLKSEIRRTYKLRNSLLHESDRVEALNQVSNIEADLERAMEAIDELHQLVYGISMDMRLSELLVEDQEAPSDLD